MEEIAWRLLAFFIAIGCFWFTAIMWNADNGFLYLLENTAWWLKNYPFDSWIPFYLFLIIGSGTIMMCLVIVGIHFAGCIFFPGKFPLEKSALTKVITEGKID